MPGDLAPALLADLTLQRISVNPETSVDSILRFREDHRSELGRFRTKIADLTRSIEEDLPLAALQQEVADIHSNEVMPAIDELKDCLRSSKKKWAVESFLKTSMLSVSGGGVMVALGLAIPHALLACAGVSLTVSAVLYNCERRQEIRKNPFSYLLSAESNLA